MRRLTALLFAAVLCLSLCACGGDNEISDTAQTKENAADGKAGAAVVQISVNPEFKLYVDNYGNVSEVEYLNEDAKSVGNKVNVNGKSCEDAVAVILQESVNQDFLKNGGKIDVTVYVAEDISNQLDTWNQIVMKGVDKVLTDNKMNASIAFQTDTLSNIQGVNSNPSAPAANMSATDADGNSVITTDRGYITLDKNGNKIKEVYKADDGTEITLIYDENENVTQAVHARTDGTVIKESYDSSGKISFERDEFADGSWTEQSFENGLLTKEVIERVSGKDPLRIEREYYGGGNIKKENTYSLVDSSYYLVSYYENGNKSYEYNFENDSRYNERTFYESGSKKTEKFKESDGTRWELNYNPDGSHYGYTYYPDGSVWYNEWDSQDVQDLSKQKRIK